MKEIIRQEREEAKNCLYIKLINPRTKKMHKSEVSPHVVVNTLPIHPHPHPVSQKQDIPLLYSLKEQTPSLPQHKCCLKTQFPAPIFEVLMTTVTKTLSTSHPHRIFLTPIYTPQLKIL
jgi:hypothetical protein